MARKVPIYPLWIVWGVIFILLGFIRVKNDELIVKWMVNLFYFFVAISILIWWRNSKIKK